MRERDRNLTKNSHRGLRPGTHTLLPARPLLTRRTHWRNRRRVRRRASGRSVYNYFRDYDAVTGRYVQSDPIGLKGGLNTYLYAGGNPLRYIDPLGLSDADVARMVEVFEANVEVMTTAGQRTEPGSWNNISRSLYDASRGLVGHNYLGCGEQALTIQARVQGETYDDEWTFTLSGSNFPQIAYDGWPTITHWWVTAKSNNPSDPVVILDPWRNQHRLQRGVINLRPVR
jgi:RHS repeat-associated protein